MMLNALCKADGISSALTERSRATRKAISNKTALVQPRGYGLKMKTREGGATGIEKGPITPTTPI